MDARPPARPALLPLPIDGLLPSLVETLRRQSAWVLEAPPGAGKTTRVPRALLDAGLLTQGECLVLQPRRLAARLAARRVAEELGESLGQTVGYQVRFEEVSSPSTRIRFITEGVLTRRMIRDPFLKGVSVVLLDEFHERHLAGDVGLGLLLHLQKRRPELKLGVMSATLQAASIAEYLGGAPMLRSEGRRFEVTVSYAPSSDERALPQAVAGALKQLLRQGLEGDVLVFLPGAGEIRAAMDACSSLSAQDLTLLPLHGELSAEEQDRAVRRAQGRKVIFSTNVAETSVTIDGVVAVIDSGLARVAGYSPWSGLPSLSLQKISQASAIQRAGRAGRTRPGTCIRLYSLQDFQTRPAFDPPEVRRVDLAETVLELKALEGLLGLPAPAAFSWLDKPLPAALETAETLLVRLGALEPAGPPRTAGRAAGLGPTSDPASSSPGIRAETPLEPASLGGGQITELGRRMLNLPVHPRQARMLIEAERSGVVSEGALLAALVAEKEIVLEQRARALGHAPAGRGLLEVQGPSDLLARMDVYLEAMKGGFDGERLRRYGLEAGACAAVERSRQQLARLLARGAARPGQRGLEDALLRVIVAGYPDRVARRRPQPPRPGEHARARSRELIFAFGGVATLSESSIVLEADPLVALDAESKGEGRLASVRVRLASRVDPGWLVELFPSAIVSRSELRFDPESESVVKQAVRAYGNLVIDAQKLPVTADEAFPVLWDAVREAGPASFVPADGLEHWQSRLAFVARAFPREGIGPATSDEQLEVLELLCAGLTRFSEVRAAGVLEELQALLRPEQRKRLDALAPEKIRLPGGRQVRVAYPAGGPPFVESRLQDFFGLRQGPSVGGGTMPLVLHLLAPNGRAVQVTSDLTSFWSQHYPALRRELGRKYPRHSWPEDPLTAEPPGPGRR